MQLTDIIEGVIFYTILICNWIERFQIYPCTSKNGKMFQKHDITLSHKASNTTKTNVCQLKDRRTALETKNAIYKINCKNCDLVYIGESSKVVGDRVKEHSSNVWRRYQGSLIYKHSNETGHEFDFDNPKV